MSYTYRHINPPEFSQRNQDFCATDGVEISPENAKRVGIICLRAIQIYQGTKINISREKSSLKVWVREQRGSARNHGRLISYKGASKTRASINASISNINDQVLNHIDSMLSIIDSNSALAKQRLEKCLKHATISDIKSYEVTYIEEKEEERKYRSLKSSKIALYVSMAIVPIIIIAFVANATINWLFSALLIILLSTAWGITAFYLIQNLTDKIKKFDNIKTSIEDLKAKKAIEEQDSKDFLLSLIGEPSKDFLEDAQEAKTSQLDIVRALAKKLKDEYVLLENACLNFEVDANNWIDLAEKICVDDESSDSIDHKQFKPQDDEIKKKYTADDLKARFSSFQEAKEFYGISAKSWQALVDKLSNHEKF
jgi:hypothetical protein